MTAQILSVVGRPLGHVEVEAIAPVYSDADFWPRLSAESMAKFDMPEDAAKRACRAGNEHGQLWERLMEYGELQSK